MEKKPTVPWKQAFCARVAELRARRGFTQHQMAESLGIPLERYKKYENRTPLPHMLVHRFCLNVNCNVDELFAVDRPLPKSRSAASSA